MNSLVLESPDQVSLSVKEKSVLRRVETSILAEKVKQDFRGGIRRLLQDQTLSYEKKSEILEELEEAVGIQETLVKQNREKIDHIHLGILKSTVLTESQKHKCLIDYKDLQHKSESYGVSLTLKDVCSQIREFGKGMMIEVYEDLESILYQNILPFRRIPKSVFVRLKKEKHFEKYLEILESEMSVFRKEIESFQDDDVFTNKEVEKYLFTFDSLPDARSKLLFVNYVHLQYQSKLLNDDVVEQEIEESESVMQSKEEALADEQDAVNAIFTVPLAQWFQDEVQKWKEQFQTKNTFLLSKILYLMAKHQKQNREYLDHRDKVSLEEKLLDSNDSDLVLERSRAQERYERGGVYRLNMDRQSNLSQLAFFEDDLQRRKIDTNSIELRTEDGHMHTTAQGLERVEKRNKLMLTSFVSTLQKKALSRFGKWFDSEHDRLQGEIEQIICTKNLLQSLGETGRLIHNITQKNYA